MGLGTVVSNGGSQGNLVMMVQLDSNAISAGYDLGDVDSYDANITPTPELGTLWEITYTGNSDAKFELNQPADIAFAIASPITNSAQVEIANNTDLGDYINYNNNIVGTDMNILINPGCPGNTNQWITGPGQGKDNKYVQSTTPISDPANCSLIYTKAQNVQGINISWC